MLLAASLLGAGCGDDDEEGTPAVPDGGVVVGPADGGTVPAMRPPKGIGVPPAPKKDEEGCPLIYAQDRLPTFEIEIAPEEWTALRYEWDHGNELDDAGRPSWEIHPYHPLIAFKYDGAVVTDAAIRVRGNPDWWGGPKMQFQISFNEYDKNRRFRGLRKIVLDAAAQNKSFLRDRLSLWVMRHLWGVPSPCANNARLVVNGEYYGLYTNIEKVDREFLERNFTDPDGNLYKRGDWSKETNESDPDRSDIEAFKATKDLATLETIANLEEFLLEWAGEAVLPDADGAWAGGKNYYMYNDPVGGWTVIPWDMDATFTRLPYDVDPYTWIKPPPRAGRPQYEIVLADPVWFDKYLDAIEKALAAYDPKTLEALIDEWSEQIREAAETDPNKPFTNDQFHAAVQSTRAYVAERHAFVTAWLACRRTGATSCP